MGAKQAMGLLNTGLSIFSKLQQITIRNEKIKAINQQKRYNDALIADFEQRNTIQGELTNEQSSTRRNQ